MMQAPRFYLFFVKKGLPSTCIFFFLVTYHEIPWFYNFIFVLIVLVTMFLTFMLIRFLFKRKTGATTYFRLRVVMKEEFFKILKNYGIPISLFAIILGGIVLIPWIYFWKMMFVLIFLMLLNYMGCLAFYLFFKRKQS